MTLPALAMLPAGGRPGRNGLWALMDMFGARAQALRRAARLIPCLPATVFLTAIEGVR